jgi:hypothetical protein
MRTRRLGKNLFRLARHGLAVSAALAYWVIAAGVPLPLAAVKDLSVPFPCMHRACGCHSAAGCKEHCCCFTDEQKLAWAADHEVDPTPFVSDRAWRHDEAKPRDGQPQLAAACCAHEPSAQSNCGPNRAAPCASNAPPATGSQVTTAGTDTPSSDAISISAYRQCHGFAPLWTLAGASLPPPDVTRYDFPWVQSGSVPAFSPLTSPVSFCPPTPPPRG